MYKGKYERLYESLSEMEINGFRITLSFKEIEEILHFNLMGETDPRVIMYQQCIQVEVDRVWRPPLGVPKGTECEVLFVVDRTGSIKEFIIQKNFCNF